MAASGKRDVGSDHLSTNILCDPCKGEDEDENAACYCIVCNEYLCNVCAKAHDKFTISKHHQLLDQDDMPKQKYTSSGESMCNKHNGNLAEYYCKFHEDCCCSVCVRLEHKKCKIRYIDDIAKDFGTSLEYNSVMSSIADCIQSLNNTKKIALEKRANVWLIYMSFFSEVKKYRSKINKMLDSLEQRTLIEAKRVRENDAKSTESASTTCDKSIFDLEKLSSSVAKHKKYKQHRQLVVSVKRAKTQINQNKSKTAELAKQCAIRDYTFRPNGTIFRAIRAEEGLGKLENRTADRKLKIKSSVPSKSVSLRYVDEVDMQHPSDTNDKGCWITGGVMLDNNILALADSNNYCIKTVDLNKNKMVSCLTIAQPPRDITRVGRDQIVVTCHNSLLFLKIGIPLYFVKKLEVDSYSHGIVYTDNVLIVSFIKPVGIKVIDLDGNTLRSIATDTEGQSRFDDPYYIALSTDQKTLFVSDLSTNSVTSMDLYGTVQHVFKHHRLVNPFGLAVDREDNIYIAGLNSSNIHIISPQCTTKHIVEDGRPGMENPQAVIYCDKENKLYITPCNERGYTADNTVSIYQIE